MSVHYKRFSGWIHGISLAQVELAVVVAGHEEAVVGAVRRFEVRPESVETPESWLVMGDLRGRHQHLFSLLGSIDLIHPVIVVETRSVSEIVAR